MLRRYRVRQTALISRVDVLALRIERSAVI